MQPEDRAGDEPGERAAGQANPRPAARKQCTGEHPSRFLEASVQAVIGIVRIYAVRAGLGEKCEDCILNFVEKQFLQGKLTGLPFSPEEEQRLHLEAQSWVRRHARRQQWLRHKELPLVTLGEDEETIEPAWISPDPDPLAGIIADELTSQLLAPLSRLTVRQRDLFQRHVLDDVRLVDLQEEMGCTAEALWKAMSRIRKRLIQLYQEAGLTTEEIAYALALLYQLRSRH